MHHIPSNLSALTLAAAVVCSAAGSANAAGVNQMATISADLAVNAALAAKDACLKTGFRVSVTVVDAAGVVLVTLREDGAAPHTVSTSERKAYTALSSRMPTSQTVKILVANPDAFGMRQIDGFLLLNGGVPIKFGESVIGAIGVSGGPGADSDEKCAIAGISSITARLDSK